MREIKYIVIHCTAAPANQKTSVILDYWKRVNGWRDPGYHFIVNADGSYEQLHPIEKPSNGVAGYNANSLHICYKGGANGVDTRTKEQKATLLDLVRKYSRLFPNAEIKGHRQFAGVTKLCPSFDVTEWVKCTGLK